MSDGYGKSCAEGGKYHPNAKHVGTCYDGCCDDYECPDCGLAFREENPD